MLTINVKTSARNGLGMQNTLRNHMSHMKFKETNKKLYVGPMRYLWQPSWILAFCTFPAKICKVVHLGCVEHVDYFPV